ncbi:uncharacterized protein LOC119644483 [Glossina fuscipes]|uniref:Uncharacterized protein LOC119644480 n=1 Tax=Glossina fuscipes TaxID=7396 RepID=A0A9C5ZNG8_9MUSC|nr:uncharacterized protein LOC119644480 [Glossina fuscipes]XP_037899969.1 uncharacterized protein LOC119644483 [Glossina fuscipes]
MIIVLLLFFQSICLYCQRLVLYIHDRWINPKNVRLLKEAAESAKSTKIGPDEYQGCQVKRSRKRGYVLNSSSSNALGGNEYCRFCANTPQGYCRHHFHLQELHMHKLQQQKEYNNSLWCSLGRSFERTADLRQLRRIKRELKRNLQQQKQQNIQPIPLLSKYKNVESHFLAQEEQTSPTDSGYQSSPLTSPSSVISTTHSEFISLLSPDHAGLISPSPFEDRQSAFGVNSCGPASQSFVPYDHRTGLSTTYL